MASLLAVGSLDVTLDTVERDYHLRAFVESFHVLNNLNIF
jgi:hypothetical protein